MKKIFKKITLFSTALVTSLPAYIMSGWGIAGLTIGAAAAVAATAALVHKHNKEKKEVK